MEMKLNDENIKLKAEKLDKEIKMDTQKISKDGLKIELTKIDRLAPLHKD